MSKLPVGEMTITERVDRLEARMKKARRALRRMAGLETEAIGFRVEQHDDTDDPEIPEELRK